MKYPIVAEAAPLARTKESQQVAVFYALLLTILAVAQLFTLEDFIDLFHGIGIALGWSPFVVLAPLVVVAEVLAIPFLLRMRLSRAFRFLSLLLGWAAPVIWLAVSLTLVLKNVSVATVGFLGTVLNLVPGWWAVFVSVALLTLAAWSSWGLWTYQRDITHETHKKAQRK